MSKSDKEEKSVIKTMKCVSIDLDGTLLNSQNEISVENLKALEELQNEG